MTTDSEISLSLSDSAVVKLQEVIDDYPEEVAGLRLKIVGRSGACAEHW